MDILRVWSDHVMAMDCGDKAGAWISRYLGMDGCRLMMYIPEITQRKVISKITAWKTYATEADMVRERGLLKKSAAYELSLRPE